MTWRGEAPSVRAASSSRGSSCPHNVPDRADDHGQVEVDVGDEDRPDGLVERGREQGQEGGADDDRRQDERHRDQRQHHAAAGEPVAGQHVGRQQPDDHREGGAERACHNVNQATERRPGSVRTSRMPPADSPRPMMAATGQAKKMARKASGERGQDQACGPARRSPRPSLRSLCGPLSAARAVRCAHRSTACVHAVIHWSRCAAMSCGLIVSGWATGGANSMNSCGRGTPSRTG